MPSYTRNQIIYTILVIGSIFVAIELTAISVTDIKNRRYF